MMELFLKLLDDPVWGPECRTISGLNSAQVAKPVIVGGTVRDLAMGRQITDLDIATTAPVTARTLAAEFATATGRRLVEYSHDQTIYRVTSRDNPQVDFTDPVGGTRESDLLRRDFTINSIAMGIVGSEAGEIFDPLNGFEDIENRIVRMTGPGVFDDDPLRLLRAFRFEAQLGFRIVGETLEVIREKARAIRSVAGERIQLELLAIMDSSGVSGIIEELDSTEILLMLFPELARQKGLEQNGYHHLDVWGHTLESLEQLERVLRLDEDILHPYANKIQEYIGFRFQSGRTRRSLIKLAMLLHDIAKPHCMAIREDGRITFIGHERRGADLVMEHMTRLKFPSYERDFVCAMITGHLRPTLLGVEETEKPRVAYKFFRDFEDAGLGIILMSLADRSAAQGVKITDEINDRHKRTMAFLLDCLFNKADIVVKPPHIIDGGILMRELGLEPGPMIGHLLGRVQEAQVMGEVSSGEEALEFCRRIVEKG